MTSGPAPEGEGRLSEPDTRSYSERYAASPEPTDPPPPSSSGSLDARLLAVIGVGLLGAAIVAAILLRGPGSPTTGVAATPTAAATATASAAPAATPDPGDLALQRFWALIDDPKLSYHLETKGGGVIGPEAYSFSESLDVSGDTWKGLELAHGLGSAGALQIVALDTTVYLKFPDGWHRNIEHDPYFRSRPLLGLDSIRDLSPSKTVVKGGQTLYDLKSTTNYQPYPGRLIGFLEMGVRVNTLDLDVLVTAAGVPVQATVHILAGGLGAGGKPAFDAKATRTFSKVGAKFTISAPKS